MEKTNTNAKPDVASSSEDSRVEVYIPRGYDNDDPNLFVSVNGVNYLLPKGKKSRVPPDVAYEIERARGAQEIMDSHIDEMAASPGKP